MADKLNLPPVIHGLHRKPIVPHYFEPDADAHVTHYPPGCVPPHRAWWERDKSVKGGKKSHDAEMERKKKEIIRLAARDVPVAQIVRQLRSSDEYVKKICSTYAATIYKRKQMIAHHSGGRPRMLSEKDVERCTELRRAGRTYEQIGDEMGCSGGTISRVLKERKDGLDTGK